MLEPVYKLAPGLIRSGRVNRPADDTAAYREAKMTDFRLPCHGGLYHAVAGYGPDLWIPFTYADLHTTQRVCRKSGSLGQCYSQTSGRFEGACVGFVPGHRAGSITSFAPTRARWGESFSR